MRFYEVDRYDSRYDNNNGRYDGDRYNRSRYIIQKAYRAGMSQGMEDARDGRRNNANRAAGRAMGSTARKRLPESLECRWDRPLGSAFPIGLSAVGIDGAGVPSRTGTGSQFA